MLFKYLTVGIVNTIVSYVTFIALVTHLNISVAYVISYAIGIVCSYVLNGKWTFKRELGLKGLFTYPLVYAVQLITGWLSLKFLVDGFDISESTAYILSLCVSVPVGYLTSKMYFKR